jgi:hypothetical protein
MKNNPENKPEINENSFKELLTNMASVIDKKNIELYKKLRQELNINIDIDIENKSLENFYFKYLYPFERYISGLIQSEISTNKDIEFIFKNYYYIKKHFEYWFVRVEGTFANANKTKKIIDRIAGFYKDGTPIKFDYGGDNTYDLPKIIFTTHNEIIEFYESIKSLHYGNPKEYMNCILELSKINNQLNENK